MVQQLVDTTVQPVTLHEIARFRNNRFVKVVWEERKPYQFLCPIPTSIDIRYPLFLLLFDFSFFFLSLIHRSTEKRLQRATQWIQSVPDTRRACRERVAIAAIQSSGSLRSSLDQRRRCRHVCCCRVTEVKNLLCQGFKVVVHYRDTIIG